MATRFTTSNPQFQGVAARDFSFSIPEVGEIFGFGGTNEKFGVGRNISDLYIRTQNGVQRISIQDIFQNSGLGEAREQVGKIRNMFNGNDIPGGSIRTAQPAIEQGLRRILGDKADAFIDYAKSLEDSGGLLGSARTLQNQFGSFIQQETGFNPSGNRTTGDNYKEGMKLLQTQLKEQGIEFDPANINLFNQADIIKNPDIAQSFKGRHKGFSGGALTTEQLGQALQSQNFATPGQATETITGPGFANRAEAEAAGQAPQAANLQNFGGDTNFQRLMEDVNALPGGANQDLVRRFTNAQKEVDKTTDQLEAARRGELRITKPEDMPQQINESNASFERRKQKAAAEIAQFGEFKPGTFTPQQIRHLEEQLSIQTRGLERKRTNVQDDFDARLGGLQRNSPEALVGTKFEVGGQTRFQIAGGQAKSVNEDAQGNLILENGQKISQQDPNYQTFLAQEKARLGVTDTGGQTTGGQAQSSTGWVDPATGQETPPGVGEPASEFNKRQQAQQGTTTRFTLQTGEELQGLIPNYKGVFTDQAESVANSSVINDLFKAYHNRPANSEEVTFWSGKRIGDLEDTLARTEIFKGEDADKIRKQMEANGQTYIRNQAHLQQLAQAGLVSQETLTNIGQAGTSMVFGPTDAVNAFQATPSSNEAVKSTATVAETTGTAKTSGQEVLDDLKKYVEDQAASGKIINPGVDISPEMIEDFLTQAKTELGPHFDQKFRQSQQDINIAMQRIVEDFDIQKRAIDKQFAQQQEQSRESFARRGLAFSSSRQEQERELALAAKEKLDANKLKAQRDAQDLGIRGERVVGSDFLPDTPEIQVGEQAKIAQAGQFGFGAPQREEELFEGTPDTFGTLQQDRLFSEQARAGELEANERELRGDFMPNPEEFGTGSSFIGSEPFNTR